MKSILNYFVFIAAGVICISITIYSQESKLKKEEHHQSILEKYSAILTEENEIMSLRSPTSQHYKINDTLYLAKIFSRTGRSWQGGNSIFKTAADTTLTAPVSGSVYKAGSNFSSIDNTLRIQNTDPYGCENGYRAWVRYNISSIPNTAEVVEIHQYIYCTELVEGILDFLNYNIIRVDYDPVSASPENLWNDIYEGAMYEYNEWVTNPPGWEWCILNSPAPQDFTNALNNEDWFSLGYMVKCNEDDSDYRAVFEGYLDSHPPYLVIIYSIISGVGNHYTKPGFFILCQNFPNPFNPVTTIKYSIPHTSFIKLKIYDILGKEISTLVNEEKMAGTYEINWNASNLPSGVYFYQLEAGGFFQIKKMILLR